MAREPDPAADRRLSALRSLRDLLLAERDALAARDREAIVACAERKTLGQRPLGLLHGVGGVGEGDDVAGLPHAGSGAGVGGRLVVACGACALATARLGTDVGEAGDHVAGRFDVCHLQPPFLKVTVVLHCIAAAPAGALGESCTTATGLQNCTTAVPGAVTSASTTREERVLRTLISCPSAPSLSAFPALRTSSPPARASSTTC